MEVSKLVFCFKTKNNADCVQPWIFTKSPLLQGWNPGLQTWQTKPFIAWLLSPISSLILLCPLTTLNVRTCLYVEPCFAVVIVIIVIVAWLHHTFFWCWSSALHIAMLFCWAKLHQSFERLLSPSLCILSLETQLYCSKKTHCFTNLFTFLPSHSMNAEKYCFLFLLNSVHSQTGLIHRRQEKT